MGPDSDSPNVQELWLDDRDGDFTVRRCRPEFLRHVLDERARLERAGLLPPLPPDHWVWEALKQLPPENGNSESSPK